jgi:glycosyltransferase 2 family protein
MTQKLNPGYAEGALISEPKRHGRMTAGLIIKFALSAAILGVLFWKFRTDLPSLRQIDPLSVTGAIALLLLQPPLIGLRWWLVLRMYGSDAPPSSAIAITWVSVFANQFLPASVGGDAVRIYYARQHSRGLGAAVASVVIDRLVALLALAVLMVALAPILADLIDQRITVAVGILCALGIVAAVVVFRAAGEPSRSQPQWPLLARGVQIVHYMLRIVAHPTHGVITFTIAVIVHLLSFFALLLIARGLGIHADAGAVLAIAAIVTFIQVVPISIGGWGVREVAAITLLGLIRIEPGTALLASIVLGLSYGMASLPGAAIWPYLKSPRGPDHS